jgi:hypothetical protein
MAAAFMWAQDSLRFQYRVPCGANARYCLESIVHSRDPVLRDEYVHGAVHMQTIEGFWSLVKRGVMGTFHKVRKK